MASQAQPGLSPLFSQFLKGRLTAFDLNHGAVAGEGRGT